MLKTTTTALLFSLLFLVLSSTAAFCLSLDFRPPPMYHILDPDGDDPFCAIVRGRSLTIEFTPPGRMPNRVSFPLEIADAGDALFVTLRDPRNGRPLTQRTLARSGRARIELPNLPAGLGRIALEFASNARDPRRAPRIAWAGSRPRLHADVKLENARIVDRGPLMLLEYPWPSRVGLLLWLPTTVTFFLALRRERLRYGFLILLSISCMVTSLLMWQQHYSHHFGHWDADGYGRCADTLAGYLARPDTRSSAAAWFRGYPHAHTALAPALMALPIALGIPREFVYVEFSTLCSFASLWLFFALLRRRLRLSHGVALLATTCFACHVLFLRSFARPVTDALGLLLTLWTLDLLLARTRRATAGQTAGLALLVLLHPLARPQGVAYVPFIMAAVLLCDTLRSGRLHAKQVIRTTLYVLAIPLSLLAGLYLAFGWSHNVELMLRKAQQFRVASNAGLFFTCLVGTCQFLPLLWPAGWKRWRDPRRWILLLWAAYYLLMLLLVKAPFWLRHFLPILPVVMVLTAGGLEDARGRLRHPSRAAALAFCLLNLAAALCQIYLWTRIPDALRPFISSG